LEQILHLAIQIKPTSLAKRTYFNNSIYAEDCIMKNLQTVIPFHPLTQCRTKINRSFLSERIIVLLVIFALPMLASTNCFASESCITADCHANMGKAEFVHEPVADSECDMCHVETGETHPGEARSFELTEQGPALCLQCHDAPGVDKKNIHPPVEDDCTNCHNPHQGTQSKFLHKPLGELCLSCHDQVKKIIQEAKSKHAPVAKGECLSCHLPHASDNSTLFTSEYPRNAYTPYKDEKFALCFACHDSNVFNLKLTTELTNFRNGNQNLHFAHTNRYKGRVCVNCHGVHGADQLKLIHSESPAFGIWNIPITIKMTETGATCFVGCHKKKSYDRVTEVVNR